MRLSGLEFLSGSLLVFSLGAVQHTLKRKSLLSYRISLAQPAGQKDGREVNSKKGFLKSPKRKDL